MTFNNRTAVITGAAGRIGRATAFEFARYGVKLFLADINMERLEQLIAELRQVNAEAYPIYMDVSSPESIDKASCEIFSKTERVDILVNNAGAWPKGSLLETSDDQWNFMLNLNLTSVFRISKIFVKSMLQNNYGRIINIGSIAGVVGLPGYIAYSSCKAGVQMMTKVMAMEMGDKNITVNSISPGLIGDEVKETTGTWVGYTGTGDDVARAIAYLANDEAGFITGSDMPVDGGRTLGPLMKNRK